MADTTARPPGKGTTIKMNATGAGGSPATGKARPVPGAPGAVQAGTAARMPARRRAAGPLPAAVAIRAVAVPDTAPPYDEMPTYDEMPPGDAARVPITSRPPGAPQPAAPGTLRQPPVPAVPLPPAAAWPSRFAQVLTETLAGSRPPSQVAPWTTEQARRRLRQLGPMLAAAHRPRVRRVIACSPAADVLEMTVIVGIGDRVRAVAIRMERSAASPASQGEHGVLASTGRADWRCTAIEAA